MTTKAEWKERALTAERQLVFRLPPTFDTLTVCFSEKRVTFRGRVISAETDCIAFPITSDQGVYVPNHEPIR